jgi:predicted RNase H-like HicB family nuclease
MHYYTQKLASGSAHGTPHRYSCRLGPEASVWVATTSDLRGLVTEADTIEVLRAKLPGMILDLLEEYGDSDLPASIEIIARASERLIAAE